MRQLSAANNRTTNWVLTQSFATTKERSTDALSSQMRRVKTWRDRIRFVTVRGARRNILCPSSTEIHTLIKSWAQSNSVTDVTRKSQNYRCRRAFTGAVSVNIVFVTLAYQSLLNRKLNCCPKRTPRKIRTLILFAYPNRAPNKVNWPASF